MLCGTQGAMFGAVCDEGSLEVASEGLVLEDPRPFAHTVQFGDTAREIGEAGLIGAILVRVTASPARRAKRRVLGERADLAQRHRVAGEAEDVADALTLAPAMASAERRRHTPRRRPPASGRRYGLLHGSTTPTSPPSSVLPGRRMIATGLPVVAS